MNLNRIAMISVHTCPLAVLGGKETGGMNVYVRELGRELGRRGINVDVFTRSQNSLIGRRLVLGDNARVIHVPAGPASPYNKNLLWDYLPQFSDYVLDFARRENIQYDLIHGHYWLSGTVGEILRDEWDIPLIQMFHTLGVMKNAVARTEGEKETDRRIEIERQLMQSVDRLVAPTPMERAQLIWHYNAPGENISVIPCGVDLNIFYPRGRCSARQNLMRDSISGEKYSQDERIILFAGRIEPLKGIDTLIKAMAQVVTATPLADRSKLRLLIVGGDLELDNGEFREVELARLSRLGRSLDISEHITFLGAQPQDRLPDYYNAADIVVMPSHYESFGMVALEAMACGTPVIASRVGGLAFTVEDGRTGLLVPEGNPEALADQIARVLASEELREHLGRGAALRAKSYGWSAITDRMLNLYEEVAQQRKRKRAKLCIHAGRSECSC